MVQRVGAHTYWFFKGRGIRFLAPMLLTYNCLYLQIQGLQCPMLVSMSTELMCTKPHIDTHAHITKNKNKTYMCETAFPRYMQLPPPHQRSLSKTNGDHHRKAQLDTRQRSRDQKEPGPNRYSYITAPPCMAQKTPQKSQNTNKAVVKKSLREWLHQGQNNGNINGQVNMEGGISVGYQTRTKDNG